MKKILIVGQDNYISVHLKNYLLNRSKGFMVNVISARTDDWKALDFNVFDCIIDLESTIDEPPSEEIAFSNNRDLALTLAEKAKKEGANIFVYLSSIHIYGVKSQLGIPIDINKDTPYNPINLQGKSKLAGEECIKELADDTFKIIILRLPLVYGPDCPGEYEFFSNLLMENKTVPAITNKLSVIHISTLCAFLQYLLVNNITGIFHPQNKEYLSTLELLEIISKEKNLEYKTSKFLAWRYKIFKKSIPEDIKTGFGTVIYAKDIDL